MECRYSSELSGLRFACASYTDLHLRLFFFVQLVSIIETETFDCFFSSSLGLWDLSLHRHANINILVMNCDWEKLIFHVSWTFGTCLFELIGGQLQSLRRSLPKSTMAPAHRCSVRKLALKHVPDTWASSARLR